MRRTYRSKKDTGGALDPRDVFRNMDEKSSAFDAFYIQNIKQTKRELSCVASSNLGDISKKVHKRKYVRRILKQVEPLYPDTTDTLTSSAYLTPDKSIRVNKVLDPFDMLLNESPLNVQSLKPVTDEVNRSKKTTKTYVKKRKLKRGKLNYSNTDSESEKENTVDSNMTNIHAHELLVENTPDLNPVKMDDSIQKIISNPCIIINNFKRKGSTGSFNASYKNKNRLSKTYQAPALQKSPLCSTPFKEKYRGVSIFKFSPITQNKYESENTVSEDTENSDHSIILVSTNIPRKASKEQEVSTHVPDFSIQNVPDLEANTNKPFPIKTVNKVQNEIDLTDKTNIQFSSLHISETTPFLGFSYNEDENSAQVEKNMFSYFKEGQLLHSIVNLDDTNQELKNSNTNNVSSNHDTGENQLGSTKHETKDLIAAANDSNSDKSLSCDDNNSESVTKKMNVNEYSNTTIESDTCNSIQPQISDNESHYDTCNSDQSSSADERQYKREPVVCIERMNDSVFFKYYEKNIKNNSSALTEDQVVKEPIVSVEKMNDSIFFKYYHKMQFETIDNELSEQTDNDDFKSLSNYSIGEKSNDSISEESYDPETKRNPIFITDSSGIDNLLSSDENCNNNDTESVYKGGRYVGFVTTRRKNNVVKDSMFILDQSYGSSSTECDKTVLSNKKLSVENSDKVDENSPRKYLHNIEQDTTEKCVQEMTNRVNNKFILGNSMSNNAKRSDEDTCVNIDNQKSLKLRENLRSSRISTRKSSIIWNQNNPTTSSNSKLSIRSNKKRNSTMKSSTLSKRSYSVSSESENDAVLCNFNGKDETVVENILEFESNSDNEDKISNPKARDGALPIEDSIYLPKDIDERNQIERFSCAGPDMKPSIVLQPGKKWERSLSIYRRITMTELMEQSILEESMQNKGRKYRESIISTMEMQESRDSLHNDSINSRRSTFVSNPSRPTIRFVKDPNISRVSLSTSSVVDDLKGFLSEECDDTVIELSKLSIADSEHEVTVLDNFHEVERVTTAQDFVLRRCNQSEAILFDECYPETVLKNCHKIGEGVYGEVFLWRARDGRARVMKIVPIAGTVKVNGEAQKDFHEIISEIVIAMELSALRAPIADIERQLDEGNDIHAIDLHAIQNATDIFNEVLAVRCVYGPYPSRLLDLWELYDECKGSENDNPAALPSDQRYIVLELANAGQDLESYQFSSAQQAHALFQQIAFGLAVGEEAYEFEHRDLHWGNVLIAPTEQKFATFVLRGRTYRVPRRGVAATVIDYSLSRLTLAGAGAECGAQLYNDLATDDQLFDAIGDYQFHVYRLMREQLGNDWKNFEPYTNILWLHYIVDKMITALRYKRTNTKIHKHYIEKLSTIKDSILQYRSSVQYVLTGIEF